MWENIILTLAATYMLWWGIRVNVTPTGRVDVDLIGKLFFETLPLLIGMNCAFLVISRIMGWE